MVKRGRGRPRKRGRPKKTNVGSSGSESIEELQQQKRDIETLLSSLDDAYNEANIEEDNYNELKQKNQEKLKSIQGKITGFGGNLMEAPAQETPADQKSEEKSEEKPQEKSTEKPEVKKEINVDLKSKPGKDQSEAFEILKKELGDKLQAIVESIQSKGKEKAFTDMKNEFENVRAENERIKAISETTRESVKVSDEKIQRVTEAIGELRTMISQETADSKEQTIKVEKIVDVTAKLEPEKLLFELTKRDQKISQMEMKVDKMEGKVNTMNDIMKKSNKILSNIGSLESVINVSKEVNVRLHDMDAMNNNLEKLSDKLHDMFADLTNKMEEWVFYRTKQEKIEGMVSDMIKNIENLNTKLVDFVNRDDLEEFRKTIQLQASPLPAPETTSMSSEEAEMIAQREEINELIEEVNQQYANKSITKEEYEKIKTANEAKLKKLESKTVPEPTPAKPAPAQEKAEPAEPVSEKPKKSVEDELEEMLAKGYISRKAYNKAKSALTK